MIYKKIIKFRLLKRVITITITIVACMFITF